MNEQLWLLLSVYGLGFATALHPCPFTAHLAICSLLSAWAQRVSKRWLLYTCFASGYVLTLVILALLIVASISQIDQLARLLRDISEIIFGPFLILIAMLHMGMFSWKISGFEERWKKWRDGDPGVITVIGIGVIFAVAFCPATAALFFGVLIPLSVNHDLIVLAPCVYGLGVLSPLLLLLALIIKGVDFVERDQGTGRDWGSWISNIAGLVLLGTGLYITLRDIYGY